MSQVKNFKYLGLTATICFKQILVYTVNVVTNLNKHFLKGGGQNTDPHFIGNWVNEVLGQFSQYKDPKWNLIHSVS